MRLDRGGVDRQRHAVFAAVGERFEDRLPMSALGPAIEPVVDRRVRTIVRRAIAPACPALKHINDTADDASIVIARQAGLVRRKVRLYLSPLLIAKPEQSFTHRITLGRIKFGPIESEYANWVQTLGPALRRAFSFLLTDRCTASARRTSALLAL